MSSRSTSPSLFLSKYLSRITPSSRYTIYIAMIGAVFSMAQFGTIIARKSLHASELMVTLIAMSSPVASLTALWWARLIDGRDQRKILIVVGSIGYLVFATGAFLHVFQHLLIIQFTLFLAIALFRPSENRVLQQHVASRKTGRTFGFAWGLRMGMAALVSALAGLWMNHIDGGYRNIYPVIAFIGVIGLILLASIPTTGNQQKEPLPLNRKFILSPIRDMITLMKKRKDYFRFEIAFMLFGAGFMMSTAVVPLYLVDELQLGYDVIGMARGTAQQLTMIVTIQLFGRLFDRSTPHRMAIALFALVGFYPLLLLTAGALSGFARQVAIYFAFGYLGLVMSGTMVLWQLASIRFSGGEDAGIYQSVHVAFTGIRGLFAPLTGYFIMTFFGKTAALLAVSAVFFSASLMMGLMRRIDYRSGEGRSLRVG